MDPSAGQSSTMRMRIEAAEMWFLRRMSRVSWTRHIRNEEISQMAKILMAKICSGPVIQKEELEQILITGKIQGKKAKGKQRQKMLPSMAEDHMMTTNGMLHAAKGRRWKTMRLPTPIMGWYLERGGGGKML